MERFVSPVQSPQLSLDSMVAVGALIWFALEPHLASSEIIYGATLFPSFTLSFPYVLNFLTHYSFCCY